MAVGAHLIHAQRHKVFAILPADRIDVVGMQGHATLKVRNMLSWGGKFGTSLCVPKEERIPCPWALTMMHVFWDGRVPRCPGDTEGDESVGNAWDGPLVDLWSALGSYRDTHMAHRFDELPDRCQSCTDWMTGAAQRIRPVETAEESAR